MKILHLIDSDGLYGAEAMLLALAREQRGCGLQPVIGSIAEPGQVRKALEAEAARQALDVVRFTMRPGPNVAGACRIASFIRDNDVSIIHSHGYKGNILTAFLPRRLRKVPILRTVHGWTGGGSLSRMRLYEWLDGRSLKRTDSVVVVAESMLVDARISRLPLGRVSVVPNGIAELDIDSWQAPPEDQELLGSLRGGAFIVGAIGRLSAEKGFKYLVEAVHLASQHLPEIRAIIIGEGQERGSLEESIARCGLTGRFHLLGYRPAADRYLRYCDIMVLPSLTEGLPICILEALRCGLPIIASSVGGIPGLLEGGEYGTLVRPGDPELLAHAILACRNNPEETVLKARAGQRMLAESYSSFAMAQGYERIYRSLMNDTRVA